MQKATILSLPR